MTHIVILVPGIMGSILELDGEVIWPGPVNSLLLPYGKMRELMREDLVATDCIRSYFISQQYQRLVEDLETCGMNEADGTLVVAAYDWRKDNARSADTLAAQVDDACKSHRDSTEISIVAHSMGGLISRYYLESGTYKNRPGYKQVRRLITLGTPHRGAAVALPVVLGYEKRLFLSKDQVLQLCSDPRYPAAYQLLPPPEEPFAWSDSPGSALTRVDVFEASVANKLGLIQRNLSAAREFHSALNLTNSPEHVRYFCFAGTRQTTTTHVLIREKGANRCEPVKIEQEDGGDGTVPTWSASLDGKQRMYVGGEHGTIYTNRSLRRTLAALLGKEGYLVGLPAETEVVIREKVVQPRDFVHVTITFDESADDFSGVLTIERARVDTTTGRVEDFGRPVEANPIQYKGLSLRTMSLVFAAPNIVGVYRVAFRDDPDAEPSGYDQLLVQQPPKG